MTSAPYQGVASQIRRVRSCEVVAIRRPSGGLKAMWTTWSEWSRRVSSSRPDSASQILAVRSALAVAMRRPSGLKATSRTLSVCPLSRCSSRPVATSQIRTRLSHWPTVASRAAVGAERTTWKMAPSGPSTPPTTAPVVASQTVAPAFRSTGHDRGSRERRSAGRRRSSSSTGRSPAGSRGASRRRSSPVRASQSRMIPSLQPPATVVPSGLYATSNTPWATAGRAGPPRPAGRTGGPGRACRRSGRPRAGASPAACRRRRCAGRRG